MYSLINGTGICTVYTTFMSSFAQVHQFTENNRKQHHMSGICRLQSHLFLKCKFRLSSLCGCTPALVHSTKLACSWLPTPHTSSFFWPLDRFNFRLLEAKCFVTVPVCVLRNRTRQEAHSLSLMWGEYQTAECGVAKIVPPFRKCGELESSH